MNEKELLERVVDNALDFLARSLDEFESRTKYSVIHFHAGIELLLKARLMAEHWSLVVSKRQDPDWKRLESGDFISVSLDDAAERLDKIVRLGLTKRELEVFRSLARHRNRMVHFFHDVGSKKAVDALLQEVASEQLVAWYLLHRLLLDRWAAIFSPWKKQLDAFGSQLRKHEQYLQIAFEHLKPEIEKLTKDGASFRECPSCGFASMEIEDEVGDLFEGTCLVCTFHERCLEIECPDCKKSMTFFGEGFGSCPSCNRKFEPQYLVHLVEEDEPGTKDYFESGLPGHCVDCDGVQTIASHGGKYVCASCFQTYESDELHQCDWCGDLNAGDMEDSSWAGCVACEGRTGHFSSKDD